MENQIKNVFGEHFKELINLNISIESSQELLSKYFYYLQEILNPESTFEVGAFESDFSKKIKKQIPKIECWAFEANPYNFEYFSKRNHFYSIGINYINLAVSNETGEIDFYIQDKILSTNEEIDKIRGNNSILNRCDENISYISTRVKSISLNDFFKNFNLVDKTKSLWIDVEGASENVLVGCSKSFENILSIMIEVENKEYWKDQWFSNDVIKYLEEKGFYPIMRDYWIDNSQYNIVFLNEKIFSDKFTSEKVLNLVNQYLKELNLDKKTYTIEEKLRNFPSINFISIEESEDRRKLLYENCKKYNINKITPHIFKRYDDSEHKVIGRDVDVLAPKTHRGPVTSHLKSIRHWYENTDEEYTIFCEDDISFETVQYWNFTWEEFFNSIPEEWDCIQLSISSTHQSYLDRVIHEANNKMRPRDWCDWSCVAYIMKRSHAKKILDNYYYGDTFCLEYKGWDLPYRLEVGQKWNIIPNIETLAYSTFEEKSRVYICALFVENLNFSTTWGDYTGVSYSENYLGNIHILSYQNVVEWWRTNGQFLPLNKIVDLDYINLWYNQ